MAKRDTLKTHQYSLWAFEWTMDVKPNKVGNKRMRNQIRKERQEGKKIIRNELKSKRN